VLGGRLEVGGNVDAVTKDIFTFDNHIISVQTGA